MIATLYPTFRRWSEKGSVYIISDTHFNDGDCKYMDPDWPSPEEYVTNICTSKNDTIIHLGDVGDPTWMKRIKGQKVLIMGNHDETPTQFEPYFDEIFTGPLMIAEKILLSHEPIDITWALNIHGHVHGGQFHKDASHINCAANVVKYKAIELKKDIIKPGLLKPIASLHRQAIDQSIKHNEKLYEIEGQILMPFI